MQAWAKSRIILDDLPMIFLKLSIQKNGGNPSFIARKPLFPPKMDCPSNDFPENILKASFPANLPVFQFLRSGGAASSQQAWLVTHLNAR